MDEDLKRGLKEIAKNAEIKVASSLLRWKYKKEKKGVPDEGDIGRQSEIITDQAHKIITKRGKNIWTGLKKAYHDVRGKEGPGD